MRSLGGVQPLSECAQLSRVFAEDLRLEVYLRFPIGSSHSDHIAFINHSSHVGNREQNLLRELSKHLFIQPDREAASLSLIVLKI